MEDNVRSSVEKTEEHEEFVGLAETGCNDADGVHEGDGD